MYVVIVFGLKNDHLFFSSYMMYLKVFKCLMLFFFQICAFGAFKGKSGDWSEGQYKVPPDGFDPYDSNVSDASGLAPQ